MSPPHAGANDGSDERLAAQWGLPLAAPGAHPVTVPITCVITRFGLRSPRYLLPTYLDYRRIAREAARAQTPGLLHSAFLLEPPMACYSLSIWATPGAIPHFGTNVLGHVDAARRVFGRVAYHERRGPEIWSTKWRLAAVSNNLNWDAFDLRGVILGMGD